MADGFTPALIAKVPFASGFARSSASARAHSSGRRQHLRSSMRPNTISDARYMRWGFWESSGASASWALAVRHGEWVRESLWRGRDSKLKLVAGQAEE